MRASGTDPVPDRSLRPARALAALLAGAVLGSTAYLLIIISIPIVSARYLADSLWLGAPNALLIFGIAGGAPLLSLLVPRLGRPDTLAFGFALASLGALLSALAAFRNDAFVLYLVATLLVGGGHAAYHLTRYAAALLVPPNRKGRAIGLVVQAAVAGSIGAPAILGAIERALGTGSPHAIPLAWLVAGALFGGASLLFFRSRALRAQRSLRRVREPARPIASVPEEEPPSRYRLAILAMAAAQAGMVLLMSMTPLHAARGGGSLTGLGAVMGAHTLGMFLLSPVVGMLCDRFTERPVIAAGGVMLLAAGLLAAFAPGTGWLLGAALYLLGLGWCFAFVAASALLAEGRDPRRKMRRQALAETLNWTTAGVASIAAGVLIVRFDYSVLALASAGVGALSLAAALRIKTGSPGSGFRAPGGGGWRVRPSGSRAPAP